MDNRIDEVFDEIVKNGFDPNSATEFEKTIVMVVSAQGIIDNGGFEYFFENTFEGNPSLQDFVVAYREIGMLDCGVAFKKAIAKNLSKLTDFEELDNVMYKNSNKVFQELSCYIQNHKNM
ncbi:DMP19 family protein [Aurantivibrio infirmus]